MSPELDPFSLASAQQREPRACRMLVENHQRLVFAILSRMLIPASRGDRVEDLAQETFLKVFNALPGFDPAGPARLSTWIGTIASRVAIDELKRKAPRSGEATAADNREALERAVEDAHKRQLRRSLEQALDCLDPELRALFVLRAYHGWSYEELSQAFEVPLGTIKSRLNRTRAVLRQALGTAEEVPDER